VYDYDVLVLGSGPSGQKAAIAAAKLGRRVAIVDRRDMLGGVCINTGTVPSKTLREAVLYLTGLSQRDLYGSSYRVKDRITVSDLAARTQHVITRQTDVIRNQLARNHIAMLTGTGRFADAHAIWIDGGSGHDTKISSEKIIIAAGTRPARPDSVDFDDRTIVDSDGVINLEAVPRSMVVVGAGVIGMEYASMFAALGTKVTVVERREKMLDFCDEEIIESLKYHLRDLSVTFRFGEEVAAVERHQTAALCVLKSGKKIVADTVMYSAGRQGQTDDLALEAAGLSADRRGRITVDANYRTAVDSIYAVGDVIGFPALASTSMEQGRAAMRHAFSIPGPTGRAEILPFAVYSIPELAYIGATEEALKEAGTSYVSGRAQYAKNPRGQIIGESGGMMKLLFERPSLKLVGAHVVGASASEVIHVAEAFLRSGATATDIAELIYNYPTLSDMYRHAALVALSEQPQGSTAP
jgi:NAD(P) transhydrogenase